MKIWQNGSVLEPEQAVVSVMDHGLLYGDGVFEGIRIVDGKVVDLDLHLQRLAFSARAVYLGLPFSHAELARIVLDTAAAHGQAEAYARLLVTRGVGKLGIDISNCESPQVICIVDAINLYGSGVGAGVRLITASWRRPDPDVLDTRVKSLNYLNSVINKHEAKQRGGDEALVLNRRGCVAEASAANIFVRRGQQLFTPPATDGALEGITRRRVMTLAPSVGLSCEERTLTRLDVLCADEVFLTGTGAGIVPVASLDGQAIAHAPGDATVELQRANTQYARRHGTSFSALVGEEQPIVRSA